MKEILNKNFPNERDLYGVNDIKLVNCSFDGKIDGESALKEASNIILDSCFLNLRYPLWHDNNLEIYNCKLTDKCRAAIWYSNKITIKKSIFDGIKALRECNDIDIYNTKINSLEFGWKSKNITIKDSNIISEYLFLMAENINIDNLNFKGKYSFQYVKNLNIENSNFDTKDAFWHASNVTVKNSYIKGEYLGWYSKNLTFIDCVIEGTQPLCYCENLKLINCKMIDTDLAFEYSNVNAVITGSILSIKNPKDGIINCDRIGELIFTEDSKYLSKCIINQKIKNVI